jgi:AcrR family transcriptional regulator
MKQNRMNATVRRQDILAAGLHVAERDGFANVTRNNIAAHAKVSGPTVQYHFGTIKQLRRELMRYAVHHKNLRVIAQGIAAGDAQALKAPPELREAALNSMR